MFSIRNSTLTERIIMLKIAVIVCVLIAIAIISIPAILEIKDRGMKAVITEIWEGEKSE